MLLSSLAKSDSAPYCYLSTQHGAAQRSVELVCARPHHEDEGKSTVLDVVFPFQSELLHGQRVFADGELKRELDLSGIEFTDEQAACDFVTDILRKGKFNAILGDLDTFTLQVKALDGSLVGLHKFDRIRQPEAIAHIKLIASTTSQHKSRSNKRLSSSNAAYTSQSSSSSQGLTTTSHDDADKPRGVETIVIADKPKKKKLRA